LTHLILKE